jgi:hypothetical protein
MRHPAGTVWPAGGPGNEADERRPNWQGGYAATEGLPCETCTMLDGASGEFIELDLGFTPTPTGGGLSLLQEEEVHDGLLLVYVTATGAEAPNRTETTALVTIVGMSQSVFGYPDEEAFWFDSRGELGKGFYELRGSTWLENVMAYNTRTTETGHPDQRLGGNYIGARHFFVASKDVSAQFLAQGLRVEVFPDRPLKAVRDEAIRRLDLSAHNRGAFPAGERAVRSYPDGI